MFDALRNWTRKWAASPRAEWALGVLSFVESSVFPIPADVIFIPMCLSRPERAMRLALIATVTSVLGGIFGWLLGHYAFDLLARPILEFYGKLEAFEALRSSTGDSLILVLLITSGLSHLPPMKIVTILSGLIGFNLPLFILSAIVARGGRFFLLAWLLKRYGLTITSFLERRLAWVALGISLLLAVIFLLLRSS